MHLRTPFPPRRPVLASCLAAATLALAACGGGGDDAAAPPAPASLEIAYGARSFVFTWAASPGATSYRLLEDASGSAGFVEVASGIPATRISHDVGALLHERVNARYAVQACRAQACSRPSPAVTPQINQAIGYFKASNTGSNDEFGGRVALSADGSTLAVSARGEDSNYQSVQNGPFADNDLSSNAGAVYVFARTEGGWAQQALLKAANTESGDAFGEALAISADGSTLAVGARQESSGQAGTYATQPPDDDTANAAGAVYVFGRSGETWSQRAYIKASNPETGDGFGNQVALSADGATLAVSAPGEDSDMTGVVHGPFADNNLRSGSGAIYLFARTASGWVQQAYAKAPNAGSNDFIGTSLALSGDGGVLAVGAPGEDSNLTGVRSGPFADNDLAPDSGAVYLFARSGGTWAHQAHVKGHAVATIQAFGSGVALSRDGATLAVGAHNEGSNLRGAFPGGPALNSAAHQSGAVYVFTRAAGTWTQQDFIKASNTTAGDHFGNQVAMAADGGTLIVGAHWRNGTLAGVTTGTSFADDAPSDTTGAAYVFRREAGRWKQQAYLKPSNNDGEEFQFGTSVSLSGDGRTAAVGAIYESGGATGIQGNQADQSSSGSGAVYLF